MKCHNFIEKVILNIDAVLVLNLCTTYVFKTLMSIMLKACPPFHPLFSHLQYLWNCTYWNLKNLYVHVMVVDPDYFFSELSQIKFMSYALVIKVSLQFC